MTINMPDPDAPYALDNLHEVTRRQSLLMEPHMAPLTEYCRDITRGMVSSRDIPHFDPCDGGIHARVLFLLEAPGRKAVGSTFISRNNPDQTAKNMCQLQSAAGIPRQWTALWNIVPWYVGSTDAIRPVIEDDLQEALPYLAGLLACFTQLHAIVLVGRKAQRAQPHIADLTSARIFTSFHPSPRALHPQPSRRQEIVDCFSEVRDYLVQCDRQDQARSTVVPFPRCCYNETKQMNLPAEDIMRKLSTITEVLEFAIGEEEAAVALYTRLAEQATTPAMREALLEFAAEEEGHRKKLQAVKVGGAVAALGGDAPAVSLADYLVEMVPRAAMTYQELLIVAMKKEKAAFKLYTDLAAAVPDATVKQLLGRLAQEEARHKLRFEIEYEEHYLQEN